MDITQMKMKYWYFIFYLPFVVKSASNVDAVNDNETEWLTQKCKNRLNLTDLERFMCLQLDYIIIEEHENANTSSNLLQIIKQEDTQFTFLIMNFTFRLIFMVIVFPCAAFHYYRKQKQQNVRIDVIERNVYTFNALQNSWSIACSAPNTTPTTPRQTFP